MHVLVTGATGFVGSHLIPELRAAGHDVRVLVREPATYDAPEGVSVVGGDLLEPGSFEDAFTVESNEQGSENTRTVDAAYYLVHSMRGGADYAERDRQAATNFRDGADAAGLDRVVYLGALGEEGDIQSKHLQSRREVESVLASGRFELTTLRAAIIIGTGSASFRLIQELTEQLPVMLTPRWVQTECHPIAIGDVVEYLLGVIEISETAGETYEIGGPEVLTYAEILRHTGRVLRGREPTILPVPVLSPWLSARAIGLLTAVPPTVARPLIHGLKTPVVAHDHRIQQLIAVELTSFETAVEEARAGTRERVRPTPVAAGGITE